MSGPTIKEYLMDRAGDVVSGKASEDGVKRDLALLADTIDVSYEVLLELFDEILSDLTGDMGLEIEPLVLTADAEHILDVMKKCGRLYKESDEMPNNFPGEKLREIASGLADRYAPSPEQEDATTAVIENDFFSQLVNVWLDGYLLRERESQNIERKNI